MRTAASANSFRVYEDYPCQISLESDSIAGDELLRQRAHDLQALQEAS